MTLEAVARALGRSLRPDERALAMIREKLAQRGVELTRERLKMAYLPEGAEPLENPVGTAPGALIRHGRTILVCLPGVPSEMEGMWSMHVERMVRELSGMTAADGRLLVVGVPEATLAPLLRRYSEEFENVYIKSHPRGHEVLGPLVEIYVSAASSTPEGAQALVRELCGSLIGEIGKLGGVVKEVGC